MRVPVAPLAIVVVVGASACEEDALSEIHPRILVCASEDGPDDDCDKAIDLGERYVGVEHKVPLYVRNRGEAPLDVRSVTSSADVAAPSPAQLTVGVGGSERVDVTFTPAALAETELVLTFASDDPVRPSLEVPLRFTGVPEPVPVLALCIVTDEGERCGVPLEEDLGVVRRTQQGSRTLAVRNAGDAPLEIERVLVDDGSSQPGELQVASSTRGGSLAPGAEALMLIVYQPADGEPDELTLTFETNDPAAAAATVRFRADSDDNLPPVATAHELVTGAQSVQVTVGDVVVLDGASSADPEGDPLAFTWHLDGPSGSTAAFVDESWGRVSFVPDVTGSYLAELHVVDSLGQQSLVPAQVAVEAVPNAVLRARLSWQEGGDVDLHLVPATDALFGPTDAHFANPRPDLGEVDDDVDDPELTGDAEGAPGVEELVFVAPAPGTYRVYAHYYDEGGAGPATVNATLTLNDASTPVVDDTRTLQSSCALWFIAEVEIPSGVVSTVGAGLSSQCP